jgi:hypothetical protein
MTEYRRITVHIHAEQEPTKDVVIDETVTVEQLRYIAAVSDEMIAYFPADDGLNRIPDGHPVID